MNEHLKKYLDEFVNGNPHQVFDQSLIDETLGFLNKHPEYETGAKAYRVYVRCLARKKTELAQRIKNKYGQIFPKPDDASVAMGFALMAVSRHPKP
ncbi:hypothetical protein [Hymenobacter koreensis]|uniref:Uncharacterized protein n=1 Tax=Hymenobacter koreensis TaxID=1084523 RepID=A0ABP8JJ57_9BACT